MSSSLHILGHPDIEQIGEERSPDGKLFAPVLKVRDNNTRTLVTLRELVHHELMQMIREDFRLGRCSAVFLEAACLPLNESDDDHLYHTAVRLNVSGRGEASVADERQSSSYDGVCLHVHEGCFTSAYGTANGLRSTKFVLDAPELLGSFQDHAGSIRDILGDRCDNALRAEGGDEHTRGKQIATALICAFRNGPAYRMEIARLQERVMAGLHSVDRKARVGNVNIFHDVIHAAGGAVSPEAAGSLFVEQKSMFAP